MKATMVPVLCLGLALGSAAFARPEQAWRAHSDAEAAAANAAAGGQQQAPQPQRQQPPQQAPQPQVEPRQDGGFGRREPRPTAPAAPVQPVAPPALPAPPVVQPPRLGVPANAAPNGSDSARGHWSTGSGRQGDTGRQDQRRDDAWRTQEAWRTLDAQREAQRRADETRNWNRGNDRDGSRYGNGRDNDDGNRAWTRGRGAASAHRDYRWRDYDRHRAQNFRFNGGRYYGRSRFQVGDYYWPRGYARNQWFIGGWLPSVFFLDTRYQLIEYWRYGLYEPPFGCHWIRIGNDALLVDDFNGEVLDEVFDLFW